MSYDLHFFVFRRGTKSLVAQALKRLKTDSENDDDLSFETELVPLLNPQVDEESLREYLKGAAREVLAASPLTKPRPDSALAQLSRAEQLEFFIEQIFEHAGGKGWVPASISYGGDVKQFRLAASEVVAHLSGVRLYDPQRNTIDDGSEHRLLAKLFGERVPSRLPSPW